VSAPQQAVTAVHCRHQHATQLMHSGLAAARHLWTSFATGQDLQGTQCAVLTEEIKILCHTQESMCPRPGSDSIGPVSLLPVFHREVMAVNCRYQHTTQLADSGLPSGMLPLSSSPAAWWDLQGSIRRPSNWPLDCCRDQLAYKHQAPLHPTWQPQQPTAGTSTPHNSHTAALQRQDFSV
jgi:hypothetical protein